MKKKYFLVIKKIALTGLIIISLVQNSGAQSDTTLNNSLVLNYAILDVPFALRAGKTVNSALSDPNAKVNLFSGMQYFSMEQSLQLPGNITNSIGYGISKIPIFKKKSVLKKITQNLIAMPVIAAIVSLPYSPAAWIHEEWHRSVMVSSYTNSYNPFVFKKKNTPGIEGVSAVSCVMDTNLVVMKKHSNPNFVRMSSAGGESQIVLTEYLQQQNFFNGNDLPLTTLYLYNMINVLAYMSNCSDRENITKKSLDLMDMEGGTQEYRDFTGFDYTAWAYDLFNPDKPYSERGKHPIGDGYDRYIYGDKLTAEQYSWIGKQAKLSRINFISPAMFFVSGITLKKYESGDRLRGNFSGRYYPTSFGNMIGIDLMVSKGKYKLFVSPHLNQNYEHSFPGLEVILYEYPCSMGKYNFLITNQIIADIQPEDQKFMTSSGQFTGFAKINLIWKLNKTIHPYITIEGKSQGWVKGNVFLEEQIGFKTGLSLRFN